MVSIKKKNPTAIINKKCRNEMLKLSFSMWERPKKSTISTYTQHYTGSPSQLSTAGKINNKDKNVKGRNKPDMTFKNTIMVSENSKNIQIKYKLSELSTMAGVLIISYSLCR